MLCNIQPITSKKVIKFELMEDPDSNDMFVGALGRMEMQRVPAAGYEIKGFDGNQ